MGSSGTCTWAKTKNYPCPANQHRAVVNIFPIFSHSLHQKGRWCRRVEIPGTRHPSFICVLSETQLWDKKIVYSKADTTLWSQTEGQRVKWSVTQVALAAWSTNVECFFIKETTRITMTICICVKWESHGRFPLAFFYSDGLLGRTENFSAPSLVPSTCLFMNNALISLIRWRGEPNQQNWIFQVLRIKYIDFGKKEAWTLKMMNTKEKEGGK